MVCDSCCYELCDMTFLSHLLGMPHSSPSDEDEDNEFYDAQSDQSHSENQQNFIIKIPMGHRRTSSAASLGSQVLSHQHPPPLASVRHSSFSSPVAPLVRSHLQHSSLDSPCMRHKSECSSPITSERKLKRHRPLSTSFITEHFAHLLSDKPKPRRESATFHRPLINSTDSRPDKELPRASSWKAERKNKHKRNLSDDLRLDQITFPRPAQVLAENSFRPGLGTSLDHSKSRKQSKYLHLKS